LTTFLYSEDSDWNILLKEKSSNLISNEIELDELFNNFDDIGKQQIALKNLYPKMSTIIYKTKGED